MKSSNFMETNILSFITFPLSRTSFDLLEERGCESCLIITRLINIFLIRCFLAAKNRGFFFLITYLKAISLKAKSNINSTNSDNATDYISNHQELDLTSAYWEVTIMRLPDDNHFQRHSPRGGSMKRCSENI